MPEIPEMEHYRALLAQTVVGRGIEKVNIERPKSLNLDPERFSSYVSGAAVREVSRRAKHLVFHLTTGMYLATHMMLDGRLYHAKTGETQGLPGKPDVILDFNDGSSLFFCTLRLGFLHLLSRQGLDEALAGLGIEPLSGEFTYEKMKSVYQGRRGAIKPLLMEQSLVCGIGNAYSNEILYRSRILPDRRFPTLEERELGSLWQAIQQVLREATAAGGYIEEPYAEWDTVSGGEIPHFMVYDRAGQPCKVCGSTIQTNKLNGRWAYYCIVCQK